MIWDTDMTFITVISYGIFNMMFNYILGDNNPTWGPWKKFIASSIVAAVVLGLVLLMVYGIHSR